MRKWIKRAGDVIPTVLLLFGSAAVAAGVWMVYPPAGLISAGVLAIVGGILLIKGGGGA